MKSCGRIIQGTEVAGTSLLAILCSVFCCLVSCSGEDDASYPSLVTELVMAQADGRGCMASFTTDAGTTYTVENEIKGMKASSLLRALCSYLVIDANYARVYQAQAVPILWNLTGNQTLPRDPTGIQSAWLAGGFVNMHLTPKTQGGQQAWGFMQDSVTANQRGGKTFHLALCHDQQSDMAAYSTEVYASISLDSLSATPTSLDSITLAVNTFQGTAVWRFPVP